MNYISQDLAMLTRFDSFHLGRDVIVVSTESSGVSLWQRNYCGGVCPLQKVHCGFRTQIKSIT